MKLTVVLLIASIMQVSAASSYAQTVSLKKNKAAMREVFIDVQRQTGYNFVISSELLNQASLVSVDFKNMPLKEALDRCFFGQPFDYVINKKTIVISSKKIIEKAVSPAQQKEITGKVSDQEGEALGGASVRAKSKGYTTSTDENGSFSILVEENETLVFSHIGFQSQEISVENVSNLNVKLIESLSDLDEVVVVGYGTQTKKDITGSVSTVSGSEITDRSVSTVSGALQGAVAGLSVTRSGSAPGSGSSILLRGITTLEGSSEPLILVDDVPTESIDDVNPDQIESISILKDGASAAIYGSRAAAGVIIITTKRAKNNAFSVNYNAEQIINSPTTVPNVVSPTRYMEIYNEYMWNDSGNGTDHFPAYSEELISNYSNLNKQHPDQYPITNWPDLILKDQSMGYRHNITMSGGTDKVKTMGTFGYEKQGALYDYREWERYTTRINTDMKISERFGAQFDVAFRVANSDQPSLDPTSNAFNYAPIYAATWSDGRIAEGKQGDNLYAMLHEGGFSSNKTYKLNGKFGVFYKPIEALKLTINFAPRYDFVRNKSFNTTIPYWSYDDPENINPPKYISGHNDKQAGLTENRDFYRSMTTQGMVDFNKSIGEHRFSGIAGFETFSSENEQLGVIGKEFISNNYPYLNQAPIDRVFDNGTSISELSYASYFGRLNYNYAGRYFLQANVRRDASSRFSKKYRWGTFPSISAGWVLSEEKFFQPIKVWFDFAKLRLSYGSLGNDRLGNYLYLSTLQFMNALFANGANVESQYTAAQRYLAIEDITWETTTTSNVGIDLALFRNRLSLTADYYGKRTENMLLNVSVPELTGYEDPMDNVGDMNTRGWELSASWKDRIGAVNYALSFNLFDSKSIIGDIQGKRIIGSATLSEQGSEYNAWYGYRSEGIYQSQEDVDNSAKTSNNVKVGDIKYMDVSGLNGIPDGVINEADRVLLGGTSLPRYQYGGTLKLGYKALDLGLTVQGVGKQKVQIAENNVRPFMASWLSPPDIIDGKYWSLYKTAEENSRAEYPRLSQNSVNNNYTFSDFWLINGAYFRLKNITFGYNVPMTSLSKIGISSLRIYLSGNDIFSIDNYPKGMDPEYRGGYLVTKSYQLGVNLKF